MAEKSRGSESRRRFLQFLAGSPLFAHMEDAINDFHEVVMRQAGTTSIRDITPEHVIDARG